MKAAAIGFAVLGMLAWIWWPKVQALDQYGVESAARGGLGTMRIALEERRKRDGRAPASLDQGPALWKSTFFRPPHAPTAAVVAATTATATDIGGWGYDAGAGRVFVDCTHTDSKGSVWASY